MTEEISAKTLNATSGSVSLNAKPRVIVMSGYGINCEEETAFAFQKAGAKTDIVHINDIIKGDKSLDNYQIMAFPGGFSYGDDTGSGNAYANRVRNHLWNEILSFVQKDNLVIGLCNGFQILVNLGLLPAFEGKYGERNVALVHNDSARYIDRWVDLSFPKENKSPWTKDISTISVPIAHGEGKFYADKQTLELLKKNGQIAAVYTISDNGVCVYQHLDPNPNGSLEDIAGITDESGRILGMMPHPERAIHVTHLPNWPLLKEQYSRIGKPLPETGPGLKIFENGVAYFK